MILNHIIHYILTFVYFTVPRNARYIRQNIYCVLKPIGNRIIEKFSHTHTHRTVYNISHRRVLVCHLS